MALNIYQAFKSLKAIEPSSKLEGLILAKIERLKEKQARKSQWLSYFGLIGSSLAFILATFEYGKVFINSEFWVILKLLSTDAGLVIGNWNDFLLSLLETFPAVSAAIILIPVFTLLLSLSAHFKSNGRNHFKYA